MTRRRAVVTIALFILLSATILMAAEPGNSEEREMIEMLEIFDDYELFREMDIYVAMEENETLYDKENSMKNEGEGSEQ